MADIPTQRIINALDGLYDRLGGWMTVAEMDTITIAKERLKEQQTEIEDLRTAMQSMIEGQCVVAGNKQQHWIPAEERLPKSMINKVIVYVQHKDLASRIGFGHFEKYHGVGTWWDLERDEPFIKHGFTVTHWMPIPKSPYGEELILS